MKFTSVHKFIKSKNVPFFSILEISFYFILTKKNYLHISVTNRVGVSLSERFGGHISPAKSTNGIRFSANLIRYRSDADKVILRMTHLFGVLRNTISICEYYLNHLRLYSHTNRVFLILGHQIKHHSVLNSSNFLKRNGK